MEDAGLGVYEAVVGGRPRRRLRVRARRSAAARPVQPLAARGHPRPVPPARPAQLRVDRRRLGPARGRRPRALRAARRHVHRRGHVRGRDRAPARTPRAGRHGDRADAGRRVPRPPRLGLRRRLPVRGAVVVRRAARPAATRRRRPPRGPRRAARRRLQPRRRVGHAGADRLRAVLHVALRDPWGDAINFDDEHSGAVREWVAAERRAVGARLPPRRPAARRHPRDQGRQPRAPRGGDRARAPSPPS